VRLADRTGVKLTGDESFSDELTRAFPECGDQAIEFYRTIGGTDIQLSPSQTVLEYLGATSPRFQSFINAQLNAFLHTSVDRCSLAAAAAALNRTRGPLYSINEGAATLAVRLAESIKRSGGTVRLNTPVLRLAYDQASQAIGVDLLSGETVIATKAVISNLTIWDTYGKLVGLNRTPPEIKKLLNTLQGTGAYLVYASIEPAAVSRLPSERLLAITPEGDDDFTEFTLAIQSGSATFKATTDVDEWFTYHASEEDFVEFDQAALERFWTKLHAALPELGGDIEVIETANPRTYYEETRRKLGMVMGIQPTPKTSGTANYRTVLPNLFIVGDTVSGIPGMETVTAAALSLSNELTKSAGRR
jgi:phytoene dehydrogenase-like protein